MVNKIKLIKFIFYSFQGRIIGTVLLLQAALMGLLVFSMVTRQQNFMENQLSHESKALAHTMSVNAPSSILSRDIDALDGLIANISNVNDLKLALFLDANGKVLAATDSTLFNLTLNDKVSEKLIAPLLKDATRGSNQIMHDGLIDSISAVYINKTVVGYARIVIDASLMQYELKVLSYQGILLTFIAIILGGLVSWAVVRKATQRLNNLSHAADQISSGNLEIELPMYDGKDEVAKLTRDFNNMSLSLKQHSHERDLAETELYTAKEHALVTLQSIGDAVITTDIDGKIQFLNPVAEKLTGWSNGDANNLPLQQVFNIISNITQQPIENPVQKALQENNLVGISSHTVLIQRDGNPLHIEDSAAPIRDRDGTILGVILVFHDVSEKRKLEQQISYQATHDALTGLINRSEFENRLGKLFERSLNYNHEHALLYFDIDQFKAINDTCSHSAGDEFLRQLSSQIKVHTRDTDTFARLGGDEFAVLLHKCPIEQAQRIANEILKTISIFKFQWQEKSFTVSASIGLVSVKADSGNVARILSAADTACFMAKENGRNMVQLFTPDNLDSSVHQGEKHWVTRISQALEENRFVLHYQPIVALQGETDETIQHFEILLRLHDEDKNIILPGTFIPAAERYNMMIDIDKWVVRTVLDWLATHHDRSILCTVNLSVQSVNDDTFLAFIAEQIEISGVETQKLCFEITESAAISSLSKAEHFIREIRLLGCSFSLDDFGSGMSSFDYLQNLPVDYLKIDGSFVSDMLNNPIDRAMLESINHIGHVMKIKTIAEFVENKDTLDSLRIIGVDYAQGYGIEKPAPLKDMPAI